MKKKIIAFALLAVAIFSLTACGKSKINLGNYLIEERNTLFTAHDEIYCVTLSCGKREENYALDGKVNPLVDFAVLTLSRINSGKLANDTYTYTVTVNEQTYNGELTKSETENSYSADLEINIPNNATVNTKISFTGYNFNKDMENASSSFNVDKNKALSIAAKELKDEIKILTKNKNNKIEVVMKLLKDHSNTEVKTFYWYIGIVSTSGETLGILIDATTGNIIAKKV